LFYCYAGTAIYQRDKFNGGKVRLFAVGANRVVPLHNSNLHGETTAIMFAESKLNHFSLKSTEQYDYILCTSCEPCAMCIGSIHWAGVSEVITAAALEDAECAGFDEGPVFPEAYKFLEKHGMTIKRNVLRAEGASVIKKYSEGGIIYN
jgi:tRNA(Arg) A34 adenosine deaminase TadA